MNRALRVILALALVLLSLYGTIWSYLLAVGALGPLGLLVFALAVGLIAAIAVPLLVVRFRTPLRRVMGRLVGGVGVAARQAQPESDRLPGWLAWLDRLLHVRFVWDRTVGIWVTLGVVAASASAWVFAELLFAVVTGGTVAGTDLRALNLVATLRTPALDGVMYAFTFLASGPAVVAATAVGVGITLLARRYADALFVALAPIAGGLFVLVVKTLVARPRPPLVDARLILDGFSFPSGHATIATTLYGTLAYVALRGWPARYDVPRALVAVGATLLIFAIGLSRVYLGVHYPSDVLAGWAAGAVWLALVVIAEHVWLPVRMPALSTRRRVVAGVGSALLVGLAGTYLVFSYPALPSPPAVAAPAPIAVAPDAVQATVVAQLPHVTETIFGAPQEPISLVFVGTRGQIEQTFAAAGWTEAQRPEPGVVGQALFDGLTERSDPAGPVAPSFLADEPNTLAFSQPVGTSFDQRHHVRLWPTNVVTTDGQPVWLGTASFDEGFGLAQGTLLPTHHIAPDIDAERDYLVASLQAAGAVVTSSSFQLVPPGMGHNFVGDPFSTDGRAALLALM
jgi:undecaprenyl-diphosphatase